MPITVENAAEVADRILEMNSANSPVSTNAISSSSEDRILQEIQRFKRRINDLPFRNNCRENRNRCRSRNRSSSCSREPSVC
ncbi:hypothetical protein AVEN_127083-1, partial [Araneus ventricosus]